MAKTNSGLLEFKDAQKVLIALDDATSEVKKAVVIDADGVETDIQGVQPTGKKEITSTEEVNVANYATAQVVDEDLVAGNIKKDVDILGVVGSYEAAASDFSTAEVTIAGDSIHMTMPLVTYDPESPVGYFLDSQGDSQLLTPNTYTTVLYKGYLLCRMSADRAAYISLSGGCEWVSEENKTLLITGNCTITVS